MKSLVRLIAFALLAGPAVLPAQTGFNSLYVFGDGVSTTTNNTSGYSVYWGDRFCNGRAWVEVLAQRLGIPNNTVTDVNWSYSGNNWSYFGHTSSDLAQNVNNFTAPTNANTALFVVWVNNADFVTTMDTYGANNAAAWANASNQSLTNHWRALTNLYYAKGARMLVMPNAVDITEIPAYTHVADPGKTAVRQTIVSFNTAFAALLNQARASLPGVRIYSLDMFALLDNMVAHAADYGLTNALLNGKTIDALDDPSLALSSLNGPGGNYIFWDDMDPTAKTHEVMADVALRLISPPSLGQLTLLNGSNRLDVASMPVGLSGFVDARTDLQAGNWTTLTKITSTNVTQTIFVPASGQQQFYRLRFPFGWSWP